MTVAQIIMVYDMVPNVEVWEKGELVDIAEYIDCRPRAFTLSEKENTIVIYID